MSGFNYQTMVGDRQVIGQGSYGQQEAFLSSFVSSWQAQLGRPLDLLEFGCGFGRHAWYLSEIPGARYHGYDFSEQMVAPLRQTTPPGLLPLEEHLFVGPELSSSIGARRFDLIFTVSVLIHNPPDRLPGLFDEMAELLTPDGVICLIENQVVPFSVYENSWHQGCWLHRYRELLKSGWDLHLAHGPVDTHDIYLFRRNQRTDRRLFRLASPEHPFDQGQPSSESDLDALGLPKLEKWARNAELFLTGEVAPLRDHLWDQAEVLRSERERVARRQSLLSLADDLHALRASSPLPAAASDPHQQLAAPTPLFQFDAAADTGWAHVDPQFRRVLHVFSQEWHGIRAAAGYLPGSKLAITAERPLTQAARRELLDLLGSATPRAVVVHGGSPNVYEVVRLAKRRHPNLRLFAVWHGSTAQFFSDIEFDSVSFLLELRRQGVLDGLASVKPGFELLSDQIHPQPLLNLAPHLSTGRPPARGPVGAALIPVANDWRKNFYTNLYAAAGEPRLKTVYVTAPHRTMNALSFGAKVVAVPRPTRADLFCLTGQVDLALNVTLSECQPMTALEALAHGVPCLTGPLGLGELDDHPYQQLAQVRQVDSVLAVRKAARALCDLRRRDPVELDQMLGDYEAMLRAQALTRYREFLKL